MCVRACKTYIGARFPTDVVLLRVHTERIDKVIILLVPEMEDDRAERNVEPDDQRFANGAQLARAAPGCHAAR